MEEKRPASTEKNSGLNTIAAIIFAVLALFQIFYLLSYVGLFPIIGLGVYVILAFSFFKKDRGILLLAGFGVNAIIEIINLFRYISITALFSALSGICIFLIAGICLTDYAPQLKDLAKKLWFVPGVLYAVIVIYPIIDFLRFFMIGTFDTRMWIIRNILTTSLWTVGLILAGRWITHPEGLPKAEHAQNAGIPNVPNVATPGEGYCSLVTHILLLVFTCGIWNLIWIYRMTRYLNRVKGEEYRDPAKKLLLCMFIPFYIIYWTYKSAERVDKLAQSVGVSSDLSTLCLILAIFVGIVPPILIQDKVNAIANVETGAVQPAAKPGNISNADELKKFKELLDSGAITQEEYESKKKELLGL